MGGERKDGEKKRGDDGGRDNGKNGRNWKGSGSVLWPQSIVGVCVCVCCALVHVCHMHLCVCCVLVCVCRFIVPVWICMLRPEFSITSKNVTNYQSPGDLAPLHGWVYQLGILNSQRVIW